MGLKCGDIMSKKHFNAKHYYECHNLPIPEAAVPCDICGKIFSNIYTVKTHKTTVHGDEWFSCDKCDYRTKDKNQLKRHMKGHFVRQLFTCHICGKSVIDKHRHLLTHNPSVKVDCPHCEKQFDKKRLQEHITKAHKC